MRAGVTRDSVHALVVPLAQIALLVPSALIAEVVNIGRLNPIALSPEWHLGVLNWRSRPVPVISFEALSGLGVQGPGPRSKIIVFYPLPGRKPFEFFAMLTTGEPQPRSFHEPEALSARVDSTNPFLATSVRLDHGVVGIPDLVALNKAFYP